jgi:outer membrane protein TolC
MTFLTVGDSIDTVLAALPGDTEAVLLGGMPHLPDTAFERLVKSLIDRKIPSFTLVGHRDVRRGVLAGLVRDLNQQRMARRVALNLLNILLGEEAEELPLDFQLDEQLMINMATAQAIGIDPTYSILTEAELVAEMIPPVPRRLSLPAVLREAEGVNLDLAASGRQVAAGLELVREARSNLLPHLQASGQSGFADGNGAVPSQSTTSGSVAFSQFIYSESARSGLDIERQQQISREEARFELRLDVLVDAAVSYLDVLRATTVERIQRNNLRLTRSNLHLAQTRLDLGSAGREEVLRWQNQIAVDRRGVIDAGASLGQAEVAINRLLNRPLNERFQTIEAGLDDPELTLNFEKLGPYIESPGRFNVFRDFITQYAWDASPELRQLDADIRAAERFLLAARRELYVPTVSVDAEARTFKNAGEAFSGLDNQGSLDWLIGVRATLPLFQGGALRARRSRAQIELNGLELRRDATRLVVGERVQSALFQASASFSGISLAQDAVTAARENLQIVRDRYSEGQIDVIRLLDAQNQALTAELESANAVFVYLADLMRVQRAAGRFDYFRSAADRDLFVKRLADFYRSKGFDVRNP